MNQVTLLEVITFIHSCSAEDRDRIVDSLRYAQKQAQTRAAWKFNRGDRVQFTSKHGMTVLGTIEKVNRTKIQLTDTNGNKWRVSPTLLSVVPNTAKNDEIFATKFYNSPWSR